MKRRRNQSIQASLDSLLDTMTNVVGILVIILVLTILGVDEAVSRISEQLSEEDQVTQEQYDLAVKEATQTAARLELARNQPDSKTDLTYERQVLDNLRDQLAKLDPKPADTDPLPNPDALAQQLKNQQQALKTLQDQLQTVKEQSVEIDKRLAVVGEPVPAKPKLVTIPNPRIAPEGAEPVFFLCKGGRVLEVPMEQLFEVVEQRIKVVRKATKENEPACKAIVDYFEKTEVVYRGIRIKVRNHGNRVVMRLFPEDGLGESVEEMQRGSARLKRSLLRMRRDNNYARYVVWPDSYEAYLTARTITDEANLPAGWQPMFETSIFERWTPFRCTPPPPPPPDPNAPPKPPVDPNAPPKPKPLPEPPID
ncbi:MAG: hypothetical protein ACPG4Q_10645 [Phycisphaeraceae bacterium]